MISIRGRAIGTRRVATVFASGLLVAAGVTVNATSATAATTEKLPPAGQQGGAVATLDGLKVYDQAVVHDGDARYRTGAGLFELAVAGGGSLQSYSVDLHNPTQEQARYQESSWRTSSLHDNPDAGKIRWILQNSYPRVNDLSALAAKAGAGRLTPQTAAAGTQVAIWRYSDGAKVVAEDKGARKLADYLYRSARRTAEPGASLALSPAALSGKPGERIGPVTVRTNASRVTVSPAPDALSKGVRVTDEQGEPLDSVRNGTRLWLEVPEEVELGSTALVVEAVTAVPVGRVFSGMGDATASQTQILAGSSDATVSATATAHWAATGPAPAVTATKNCAEGAVDVVVANNGDQPFAFTLGEQEYEVAAAGTETVAVPVQEDQRYRITVAGPGGFEQSFAGLLDCATKSAAPPAEEGLTVHTEPVTVGGNTTEPGLAETGNNSNVPLLIGIAVGLLVIGGVALLMVRRGKPEAAPDEDGDEDDGEGDLAPDGDGPAKTAPATEREPDATGAESADAKDGGEAPKAADAPKADGEAKDGGEAKAADAPEAEDASEAGGSEAGAGAAEAADDSGTGSGTGSGADDGGTDGDDSGPKKGDA